MPDTSTTDDSAGGDTNRGQRSRAEWVTLVVSCFVLAGVIALILTQVGADDAPAEPVATIGSVSIVDAQWFVDVTVENRGGATAADVQVVAELTIDGITTTGDQVIDFLTAGETEDLVFVFGDDPATGELTARVATFTLP